MFPIFLTQTTNAAMEENNSPIGWLNSARKLLWETRLDDAEKLYEAEKETDVKAAMGIAEVFNLILVHSTD